MATVIEEAHDASCLMKKWINGPCTLEGMVKIAWAFGDKGTPHDNEVKPLVLIKAGGEWSKA